MVTGRERSRFTTISSHSLLMDLKAPRGKHLSNTKQQRPRCHPSSSLEESTQNQSNLQYSTKATVRKQPSVRRVWHSTPPPPGGDALLRLPVTHVHGHHCQKHSATSWTRMFPGRPALARCIMDSQEASKLKSTKNIKTIQIHTDRVYDF